MASDLAAQAAGIGALADEHRRRLYEYVVARDEPVGREQAADALDLPRHTASFHLDRLVAEGLLEAEFRRLTGRTGPGAGRPSKLYRRASGEFAVSLPPRRYELVGSILASAIERAGAGAGLADCLAACAHEHGEDLGRTAPDPAPGSELATLAAVLAGQGYEPRRDRDVVTLRNCPFDQLAGRHPALVCGVNRDFVQGVIDALPAPGTAAHLEPHEGRCCVAVRPCPAPGGDD